jgi:hypothetical protein
MREEEPLTESRRRRAMFVLDCVVDREERMAVEGQPGESYYRFVRLYHYHRHTRVASFPRLAPLSSDTECELRRLGSTRVHCGYCKQEVGVQDQDEIFHFFNVFPSD